MARAKLRSRRTYSHFAGLKSKRGADRPRGQHLVPFRPNPRKVSGLSGFRPEGPRPDRVVRAMFPRTSGFPRNLSGAAPPFEAEYAEPSCVWEHFSAPFWLHSCRTYDGRSKLLGVLFPVWHSIWRDTCGILRKLARIVIKLGTVAALIRWPCAPKFLSPPFDKAGQAGSFVHGA